MSKNPDFYKIVTPELELVYPRLDQPYRFNEREKKTEPCAKTAPQAAWSVAVKFEAADAKGFAADLEKHYADCRERDKKLPPFSGVFGQKPQEDGSVLFVFRKNCMNRQGEENNEITIVGDDHKPLMNLTIWSGSKGRVRALAFPSVNPQDGKGGISLLLDAVMVTEAKYGGDNLEADFGPPRDTFADEDPAEGDNPAHAPDAPADESIPF